MARPVKQTVDYFPHYANHGKTLMILENEFGNDGYAFWFKLLELLCACDNQVYDYSNTASWRFLLAKTKVTEDTAEKILQILADLNAIDTELHESKIIWSQNLIEHLDLVYKRRATGTPERPVNVNKNPVNVNKSTQTKLNKTKLNKTNKEGFDKFWEAYPKKIAKQDAIKAFDKLNPDSTLLEKILASVERAKKSRQWTKDNGEFVPHPATWLNAKRWEDEMGTRESKWD